MHIAYNPEFLEKTKQIKIDCHLTKEKFLYGDITTWFVNSNDQLIDVFTKTMRECLVGGFFLFLGMLTWESRFPYLMCYFLKSKFPGNYILGIFFAMFPPKNFPWGWVVLLLSRVPGKVLIVEKTITPQFWFISLQAMVEFRTLKHFALPLPCSSLHLPGSSLCLDLSAFGLPLSHHTRHSFCIYALHLLWWWHVDRPNDDDRAAWSTVVPVRMVTGPMLGSFSTATMADLCNGGGSHGRLVRFGSWWRCIDGGVAEGTIDDWRSWSFCILGRS